MSHQHEEFDLWLSSAVQASYWVKHHRFEKARSGDVTVDGGVFQRDEAKELFRMLNSSNPLTRLSATLAIWERNRTLLYVAVIFASLLLALVLIRTRR